MTPSSGLPAPAPTVSASELPKDISDKQRIARELNNVLKGFPIAAGLTSITDVISHLPPLAPTPPSFFPASSSTSLQSRDDGIVPSEPLLDEYAREIEVMLGGGNTGFEEQWRQNELARLRFIPELRQQLDGLQTSRSYGQTAPLLPPFPFTVPNPVPSPTTSSSLSHRFLDQVGFPLPPIPDSFANASPSPNLSSPGTDFSFLDSFIANQLNRVTPQPPQSTESLKTVFSSRCPPSSSQPPKPSNTQIITSSLPQPSISLHARIAVLRQLYHLVKKKTTALPIFADFCGLPVARQILDTEDFSPSTVLSDQSVSLMEEDVFKWFAQATLKSRQAYFLIDLPKDEILPSGLQDYAAYNAAWMATAAASLCCNIQGCSSDPGQPEIFFGSLFSVLEHQVSAHSSLEPDLQTAPPPRFVLPRSVAYAVTAILDIAKLDGSATPGDIDTKLQGRVLRWKMTSNDATRDDLNVEGSWREIVARIKTESDRYGDTIEPVLELAGGKLSDGIT